MIFDNISNGNYKDLAIVFATKYRIRQMNNLNEFEEYAKSIE